MQPADFQALFAYDRALTERLWASLRTLTPAQFRQQLPYSHGSLRNQMLHLAAANQRWLHGLREVRAAQRPRVDPDDYPDQERAYQLWHGSAQELQIYLANLQPAGLEYVPRGMRGPVWQVLLHLINHGTDHRAQVLRSLHDFGVETFDQDLILHLWQR